MKLPQRLGLGLALAPALLAAGCTSTPTTTSHWSSNSIGPSMSRALLSYHPETDGSYRDFQWEKKQDINLTLMRHLLNYNPYNPYQPESTSFFEPRPPHSLLPRPWNYIHLEGLAVGAILYAAGGAFIPIPIDSVIGTLEEGGTEEFMAGVETTLEPPRAVLHSFMHDALSIPEPVEAH